MKKAIKIFALLLVFVAVMSLVSCGENEKIKQNTTEMLDALIAGDFSEAYNLVSEITTSTEFTSAFNQMSEYLDGVKEYELNQIGFNANTTNGTTVTSVTYLMKTNVKTYVVEAYTRTDVNGLYGFYILESQINSDGVMCGTLFTMKGANFVQWLFLIIGFAELAFVIVVFIDAIKQKINKKPLWLLLILLGTLSIIINISNSGVNLNFSAIISLVNSTAFIRYATGATAIRIMVPVGAIVYLIKRKSLINSAKIDQEANEKNIQEENIDITKETPNSTNE